MNRSRVEDQRLETTRGGRRQGEQTHDQRKDTDHGHA